MFYRTRTEDVSGSRRVITEDVPVNFRRARMEDAPAIVELLSQEKTGVIHRSLEEAQGLIDGFWVALNKDWEVIACCGTKLWGDQRFNVEIISWVTKEGFRGIDIGTVLLCICLRGSIKKGLWRFFTLTTKANTFRKLGFVDIDKACLPQKVLADCVRCPNRAKNPHSLECDEIPLSVDFCMIEDSHIIIMSDSYTKLNVEYYRRRFPLACHYRIGQFGW